MRFVNVAFVTIDSAALLYTYISRFSVNPHYQQQIVIAKALTAQPNILIFDEPTQGIDVGARAEIYGLLEKLRADGKSIILISSETEEIQGTCDRTIVMRSGHVTGELNAEEMKDTKLMLQYMYKDV